MKSFIKPLSISTNEMVVGPWGLVYDIMAHFTRIGVGMEYWAMGEIWSILPIKKKEKGKRLWSLTQAPLVHLQAF